MKAERVKRVLLILPAVLVLAACAAGHAPKPLRATLAADARSDMMFVTNPKVSCTRHMCSMAWHDRVFDAHSTWLGARIEVWNVDDDEHLKSVHRLNLRIVDTHARRVATFACVLHHYMLRPWPKGATSVSYPDDRKSCVERLRTLSSG